MEWLAALIVPAALGFVAGRVAQDKGRNPTVWRWLTFLCFPLLAVLMVMPSRASPAYRAGAAIGDALGLAAIVLVLVGATLYEVSAGGSEEAPPPVNKASVDCGQESRDAQDLASTVTQLFANSDIALAMAQNDTGALCGKLAGIMPKVRQVRAEASACNTSDPVSSLLGDLLGQVTASCR